MKQQNSKPDLVYVKDAIHILQITAQDFDYLIQKHKIKPISSETDLCIFKDDFRSLLKSADLHLLVEKALVAEASRRERDERTGLDRQFVQQTEETLIKLRAYIMTMESIHLKYNDSIDPVNKRSPEVAAYILLARSISLAKMAIDSLADHHFEAIVLLRHIDEAINLAEYFLIERDSKQGKTDLDVWFHENRSPSNSTCRESIDKFISSKPPGYDGPSIGSLMKRLYHGKSKPVHSAHHSIMETYKTATTRDGVKGIGFDYGISSYPRKLNDLVSFYQSNIWTLALAMLISLSILAKILSEEDVKTLYELNVSFRDDPNRRRT